ncbi:MAG: caspase family protein [Deltaproteobacteria bacterium]|nr:caspase family protein [Deltaproteobacteria bacterium]
MRDLRFLLKTHYTNSRALVIGIDQYRNASPLSYAVSDAEEIRDVLVSDLAFPNENITYLVDCEASKENILRSFMRFTADDMGLDERILIFFAGHGHTRTGIRGEVGYLVPYDADMTDFSTFIRWDELTRNAELIRAKHMLFVMDACYGGLALTRSLHAGSTRFLKDMMLRYSRQVLTAGKADEVVSDSGGPLPNHSVFTGHLIEGLCGKAATENGVITASGLMSYVYGKVANDKNSNQTPHYGYFDGDGDFVLQAPQLSELEKADNKDIDSLVVVPYAEEELSRETTPNKIKKIKSLLSNESSSIELHDFVIDEVRRFLSITSEDNFKVQGQFSKDELLERISKYENIGNDMAVILACIAYWAKPSHKTILQKILARSTDRLGSQGGLVVWLNLRWYPLILELYCAGIAAVEGARYDSLASIFYTTVSASEYRQNDQFMAAAVSDGILELNHADVFKQLPGHDRHYTPMSEYLYKILQPKLDDILFIGKNYERSFDEFEVLFALVVADLGRRVPIGRFGWKGRRGDNAPLSRLIAEAQALGENWGPIKAGLFGGKQERFNAASKNIQQTIARLNWG